MHLLNSDVQYLYRSDIFFLSRGVKSCSLHFLARSSSALFFLSRVSIAVLVGVLVSMYPFSIAFLIKDCPFSEHTSTKLPTSSSSAPHFPKARSANVGMLNSHRRQFSRRPKPFFSSFARSIDFSFPSFSVIVSFLSSMSSRMTSFGSTLKFSRYIFLAIDGEMVPVQFRPMRSTLSISICFLF